METTLCERPHIERNRLPGRWVYPVDILKSRDRPGFGVPEAMVLLTFCLLLAWCIPRHESWFDEAQAWLIARDSALGDLVLRRLHYEGSPALWHILLWSEIRMHVSFLGMRYIAGCFAALGVFVWLRFNPLPRLISLLLPFTFFIQYQYAVVARSYDLAPLFAFLLMALYQNRKSSPMAFCVVAGLFANCSLHMAAFATGLVLLYARDRLRLLPHTGANTIVRQFAAPAFVLLLLLAASAATAVPTADGSSTTANPVVGAIRQIVPDAHRPVRRDTKTDELMNISPIETRIPDQGPIATKVWWVIRSSQGASSHRAVLAGKVLKHILVLLTAITVPISTSNLLAACFLCLLFINVARTQMWLSLAPYVLIQVCNVAVAGEAHHLGLLWVALICSLWALSLQPISPGIATSLRGALYAVTLVVVVLQVGWSVHALRADIQSPYSSSQATATFISWLPKEKTVAAFDDDSVTVNVYLPTSPYFNQRMDYWPFSKTNDPSLFIKQTIAQEPDVVILKMSSPDSPVMNQWVTLIAPGTTFVDQTALHLLLQNGYRETHRFCGNRFFRDASESTDCRLVFEHGSAAPPRPI